MKVCVFGVARSGTTAIYSLVQDVLLDVIGTDIDYIYEPFLWDKDVFNGKYDEVKEKLKYVNSLSIDGIYNHKKLPLFITDPAEYKNNEYLREIFASGNPGKNLLVKFIRANGRFPLLHEICPEAKFIFIIRNPMDVVHSILSRFSFYGKEFHRDDYGRFLAEVNALYGTNYTINQFTGQAEKEVLFWYYSNLFFMEKIKTMDPKPLVICHENYVSGRRKVLEKIFAYLGISFDAKYLEKAGESIGPVSDNFSLRESEFKVLLGYLDRYQEILDGLDTGTILDKSAVTAKYTVREDSADDREGMNWLTPIHMRQLYVSEARKNAVLRERLALQQSLNSDQKETIAALKRRMAEVRKRKLFTRKFSTPMEERINGKENMFTDRESAIDELSGKIIESAEFIGRLESEMVAKENIIKKGEQEKSELKKNIARLELELEQLRLAGQPTGTRIAVYDPGFREFGHNIYFNIHVLKLFSGIFDDVYYFEARGKIKETFANPPQNVKIVQIPFAIDIEDSSFYQRLWAFIESFRCGLLFLSSEGGCYDTALYTTPPTMPYTILIHIVWQMLQRIEAYNKIDAVLENAAALFIMEECLKEPLIGKNNNIFRFPYFVFADDFEAGIKENVPGSKLKIATVGFINDRRNIDFILDTLLHYKGEPLEYYLYGKPLGKVGEKIEKMAGEYSFPAPVTVYTKFDYLSDEEYEQTARDCDFILIAYDERRKLQTPGAIYQFSNQNTVLIVPEIEPFVSIGREYKDLFVFYDSLSPDNLNNLLSLLAKKGEEYRDVKAKSASARKRLVEVNREGNQSIRIKQAIMPLIKERTWKK